MKNTDHTSTNNSSSSSSKNSKSLESLKYETAQELGINLTDGDNSHLTTGQAGSIGGGMVRKMIQSYKG